MLIMICIHVDVMHTSLVKSARGVADEIKKTGHDLEESCKNLTHLVTNIQANPIDVQELARTVTEKVRLKFNVYR